MRYAIPQNLPLTGISTASSTGSLHFYSKEYITPIVWQNITEIPHQPCRDLLHNPTSFCKIAPDVTAATDNLGSTSGPVPSASPGSAPPAAVETLPSKPTPSTVVGFSGIDIRLRLCRSATKRVLLGPRDTSAGKLNLQINIEARKYPKQKPWQNMRAS